MEYSLAVKEQVQRWVHPAAYYTKRRFIIYLNLDSSEGACTKFHLAHIYQRKNQDFDREEIISDSSENDGEKIVLEFFKYFPVLSRV